VSQVKAAQAAGWLEGIQASQKAAVAIIEAAGRKRSDLERAAAESAREAAPQQYVNDPRDLRVEGGAA